MKYLAMNGKLLMMGGKYVSTSTHFVEDQPEPEPDPDPEGEGEVEEPIE